MIAPECPAQFVWSHLVERVEYRLEKLDPALQVDSRRVYLTGISMGGYGAFKLASRQAARLQRWCPCAAQAKRTGQGSLARLPTWVFHGARDSVVPAETPRRIPGDSHAPRCFAERAARLDEKRKAPKLFLASGLLE